MRRMQLIAGSGILFAALAVFAVEGGAQTAPAANTNRVAVGALANKTGKGKLKGIGAEAAAAIAAMLTKESVAEVVSEPYTDPKQKDAKLTVVDLKAVGRLPRPVPLAEIKKEQAFADLALVRMGRLSVMPAAADQFKRLLAMGGAK